jgi:hypothetical protein
MCTSERQQYECHSACINPSALKIAPHHDIPARSCRSAVNSPCCAALQLNRNHPNVSCRREWCKQQHNQQPRAVPCCGPCRAVALSWH